MFLPVRYGIARMLFARDNVALKLVGAQAGAAQERGAGIFAGLLKHFVEEMDKSMTMVVKMKGHTMLPTINKGMAAKEIGETLIVRRIPLPSCSSIFRGDVVAVRKPGDDTGLLVRRVAAVEGDEMVSDAEEDVPFRIPPKHLWITADNSELDASEAFDSRCAGPIPLENVIGRVIYSIRDRLDHGRISNSEHASWMDEPIIEYELDVDNLCNS